MKRGSKRRRRQTACFSSPGLQLEIDDRLLTAALTSTWAAVAVLFSAPPCKQTTNFIFAPITSYPQALAKQQHLWCLPQNAPEHHLWLRMTHDPPLFTSIKNASASALGCNHVSEKALANREPNLGCVIVPASALNHPKVVFFLPLRRARRAVIRNLHTFSPRARKSSDTSHEGGSCCL